MLEHSGRARNVCLSIIRHFFCCTYLRTYMLHSIFYSAPQNLFRMAYERSHFLWTHNWQISRSSWSTNTYFLKIRIQRLNVNGDLFHLLNTINHLNLKIIINIGRNTVLWLFHIFFNIVCIFVSLNFSQVWWFVINEIFNCQILMYPSIIKLFSKFYFYKNYFLFYILIIVKSKSYCRELFRSFYFGPIFR